MLFRTVSLASLLCVCAVVSVSAQVTTGAIFGTVKDSSGAMLPAATVIALNEETGISRTTQSDSAGRFQVPSLSPGRYKVSASMAGFQTIVRSGIDLTVGR